MAGDIVLVIGVSGEDSGKTLVAESLIEGFRREGFESVGFKPYAGVRVWLSPWIMREVIERGLVVSGDGIRLARASSGEPSLEEVNPIVVLFGEPRPSGEVLGVGAWSLAVLGRVSRCGRDRVDTLHFINIDALRRLAPGLEEGFTRMALALKPYPLRSSDELARKVLEGGYDREALTCFERLAEKNDIVVVESNSDQPLPLSNMPRPNAIVAVSPGWAGLVEPERYLKALELKGPLASAGEIVSLTGVVEEVALPLLEDPRKGYGLAASRLIDLVLRFLEREK